MRKRRGLFRKTFLYLFAMLLGLGAIIHLLLFLVLPKLYMQENKAVLHQHGESLAGTLQTINKESVADFLEVYAIRNNLNMVLKTEEGKQFFQGFSPFIDVDVETDQVWVEGMEDTEAMLFENISVITKDGSTGKLQVILNTQPTKTAQRVTFSILPYTLCLSSLFALLFSYGYSRKITRPVLEMVKLTEEMEQLKKEVTIPVRSQDEIGLLAYQMNQVYRHVWEILDELEKENQKITEVEREKVDFLRAASHELKTPLATLHILLENMQYNVGKYKDHETYLGESIRLVEELAAMVQEILNSSRLQGEADKLPPEKLNVQKELEQVLLKYSMLAKKKGLRLVSELDSDLWIHMNAGLFEKVCSNLLSNAIRYSEEGGEIRVSAKQGEIHIFNSCTPLSEEQMAHVFEPFYRPDFSRDREQGGNGLGLYIVKTILDASGIPFDFRAEEQGMCFCIYLQLKKMTLQVQR